MEINPEHIKIQEVIAGDRAMENLKWIRWADADYLAARVMFHNGIVVQGTILANTAIEKYLKAVFIHRGLEVPKRYKGHNVEALYDELESKIHHVAAFPEKANEFFSAPSGCYELRTGNGHGIEMLYQSQSVIDDQDFEVEGLKEILPGVATLAFKPIVEGSVVQSSW